MIRDYLRRLDDAPASTACSTRKGEVLYVGKARSLKKRVAAYAKPAGHSSRIAHMVAATASMEFVTTDTETEALLLEHNLIKRLKPRFNVLLRDDKSFPDIIITGDHPVPQIRKHRGAQPARALLRAVRLGGRSTARSTRCRRPSCCAPARTRVREPHAALHAAPDQALLRRPASGSSARRTTRRWSRRRCCSCAARTRVQEQLAAAMAAGERGDGVRARRALRDRIRALTNVQANQGINPESVEEADVFALHAEGGQACVQVFFFRAGQNWGNRAYFPRTGAGAEPGEILEAFLGQFYDDKPRRG